MTSLKSPLVPAAPSLALRLEHQWISAGSTLNPSPGPLLKKRRDTAEGCRDRAAESLLYAATVASTTERKKLHDSAARWVDRAELHQATLGAEAAMPAVIPATPKDLMTHSSNTSRS